MKKKLLISLFVVLITWIAVELPVQAERVCKVTDPTGTPLNVRDRPNGNVINALKNGREVDIIETAHDEQNRVWVRVASYYEGKYIIWGWVIREFISCYDG